MEVYTSYFYQLRFFPQHFIPFSTAASDPKWYHDNQHNTYIFIDKRGIYNGIKAKSLVPNKECLMLCNGKNYCNDNPENCKFLIAYRKQLFSIDFDKFWTQLKNLLNIISKNNNNKESIPIFLVYEKPTEKCSERKVIQDWFTAHDIKCTELKYPIKNFY